MNLFYFHVPKTAGSSINEFFAQFVTPYRFHIENVKELDDSFCNQYRFLSGHIPFTRMENLLDLSRWTTIITLREPVSYCISHLKWLRRLAEPGLEEWKSQHPQRFQRAAAKIATMDLSKPDQISDFIQWMEKNEFYYFHNTQLLYLNRTSHHGTVNDAKIQKAIENLRKIDLIGIQEHLDDFMDLLCTEFAWEKKNKPRVNINDINCGLDKNDPAIVKALTPLYQYDVLLYEEALRLYKEQHARYGAPLTDKVLWAVEDVTPKSISGWARYEDGMKKVELELRKGRRVVQTTSCNIYHEPSKLNGTHPTGYCGFQFVQNTWGGVNNYAVYVKGKDQRLYPLD